MSTSFNWKGKGMYVHSVSRCTRGVKVKLWDPLRTRAIRERFRGVITTRRYTNPPLPLPYLTFTSAAAADDNDDDADCIKATQSDSLSSIAARHKTTTSELVHINRLMTNMIFPGQVSTQSMTLRLRDTCFGHRSTTGQCSEKDRVQLSNYRTTHCWKCQLRERAILGWALLDQWAICCR